MNVMGRRDSLIVFVLGATWFVVGCGDDEPAAGDETQITDAPLATLTPSPLAISAWRSSGTCNPVR